MTLKERTLRRIKQLILVTDVEPIAICSIVPSICWSFLLLIPSHILRTDPYFRGLEDKAPQWAWAIILLTLASWQCGTLLYGNYKSNVFSYCAGVFIWTVMSVLLASTSPHYKLIPLVPEPYIYGMFSGGCAWACWRMTLLLPSNTFQARVNHMKERVRTEVREEPLTFAQTRM